MPNILEVCHECTGRGQLPNPEWTKWLKAQEAAKDKGENTEAPPPSSLFFVCDKCKGQGEILNKAGQAFLKVIQKCEPFASLFERVSKLETAQPTKKKSKPHRRAASSA